MLQLNDICILTSIQIPLKDIYMLLDRNCVEYVLYHIHNTGLNSFGNMFLTQLGCI